jgi:putative membrane-bound dehydrogenase-like protein
MNGTCLAQWMALFLLLQGGTRTAAPSAGLMSAGDAAAGFQVPAGFHVSVFAEEPDVQNPIAMAWDPRGRLWVAENYTYADRTQKFDLRLRDRVLIFEDADDDGRFDRRTVFTDQVQMLASIELGFGGTWLLCPPRLLFLPDRNGDDVPDGPAEVVLDGFSVPAENYHTFANGLKWGPDGWLYGRCGASSAGEIGAPGTPDALRVPIRGGMWRYQPHHKRFEVLAHGTTNPWGHDWNALGELFFINTVNGHLWHTIPGAHFVRPHTIDPNPRAYAQIDQHADHWHWDNSKELVLGAAHPRDSSRGGGHAHTGLSIYLADQWPAAYRGKLLTLNFHGRRVNVERLERSGSGYVGRHEPDMLMAADPWFRGIDLSYGPDGSVFVLDWSDTGECHERDGVHRGSGRIYRVTHGVPPRKPAIDLAKLAENDLAALHGHSNEWFVRQARRVLANRAARGEPLALSRKSLHSQFVQEPDPVRKLRALWSLYVIGGVDDAFLRGLLDHELEPVRAWAIRLLTDDLPIDTVFSQRTGADVDLPADLLTKFGAMARDDQSGLVRLVLASTLQRLPVNRRINLARALLSHGVDSSDHNLPALIWTGLIPIAQSNAGELASLAADARQPSVVRLIARRLGEDIDSHPAAVNALLGFSSSRVSEFRAQVVGGLVDALAGVRKARKPDGWDAFQSKLDTNIEPALGARVRELNVLFGDGRALEEVRRLALDEKAEVETRKAALRTLIEGRPSDLRSICERLVRVRHLNAVAVRGLALFDDAEIGKSLVRNYRAFHPSDRPAALDVLVSRPRFARVLLDQVAAGGIPRSDLTSFHARQIQSLGDAALSRQLSSAWGEIRVSDSDRRDRISQLKQKLDRAALGRADLGRGRAVFDRICASCHKLYGVGGEIGPDLTGSGRDNLDYLLENIIDPSATVSADFRMMVVAMRDGRVLNGLVKADSPRTVTLQTQTEPIVLDRSEIESQRLSPSSLMPDGLLDTLSKPEIGDLIAYLAHPTQVPLPREPVIVEELSFRHGADTLSGSLYRPGGTGPNPAIVMILGSEGEDRDYGGVGPALGRHFARAGFACLAWDRPGVGGSTGDYNKQTFRDRAEEALAAVRFLSERKDIRKEKIGLWGHSQGGMIAPLAASLSDDVAFLIEVSGWQGPAWKQDPARVEAELRAAGFREGEVEQAVGFAQKRMELIRGTGPYSELESAQNAVKMLPWFRSVHFCDRVRFEAARRTVGNDSTDWWSRVRCPVLVLYGDRDVSSGPPEPLIAIIRHGLAKAGNEDVTVRIFTDADHSLCRVRPATRTPDGARAKEPPKDAGPDFVPGYLETMTDWLIK